MLDARGLYPLRIAAAKTAAKKGRRVRASQLTAFYSQLADLLHSGVPLLRCLDILERQSSQPGPVARCSRRRARQAWPTVHASLGDAMAPSSHPRAFNELAVSMVRAGQEGGFLEDVLKRIADFTEHQEDLKSGGGIGRPGLPDLPGHRRLHRHQRAGHLFRAAVRADVQEAGRATGRAADHHRRALRRKPLPAGVGLGRRPGGYRAGLPLLALGLDAQRPHDRGPYPARHPAAPARSTSVCSPCRASRASSARCCTTASPSSTPCASARTRPATRSWPRPSSSRPRTSRPATPWPSRWPPASSSRATWWKWSRSVRKATAWKRCC